MSSRNPMDVEWDGAALQCTSLPYRAVRIGPSVKDPRLDLLNVTLLLSFQLTRTSVSHVA